MFKHLVVDERVYEGFKEKLCGRVERVKYGDPMDRDSMIGTLGRSGMGKRLDEVVGWMVQNGFKVVSRRVDVKEPFYPIIIME